MHAPRHGAAIEWWNVIVFADAARGELAGLGDGDAVSAVGSLEFETYEKNGGTRIARRLIADRVVALKPTRKARRSTKFPSPRSRRASTPSSARRSARVKTRIAGLSSNCRGCATH